MIYIIGGEGLTGSAIVRYLIKKNKKYKVIQRNNAKEYFGTYCDILIYANGNAKKFKAEEDPCFDFINSVASVALYIHKINFKKFIHISTVDVYSDLSYFDKTIEDFDIDISKLAVYGFHKLMAEEYIKKFAENYLIFRLPALVGEGLTKNPIYDFIHEDKKMFIDMKSELNVLHTDFMAKVIFELIDNNINNECFNLGAKNSIVIGDIQNIVGFNTEYEDSSKCNIQKYKINVEKIKKVVELESSEQAIERYFNLLNKEKLSK